MRISDWSSDVCSSDLLALARTLALEQGGQHAHGEIQRAAAKVADQIERRHRLAAGRADGMQGTGERDVVDVMPGRGGERAVLAPAGHAAIDEPGVALLPDIGTASEA